MSKTISPNILAVLLVNATVFLLASCGAGVLTSTSAPLSASATPLIITAALLPSPTAAPPYIHYTPSKGFNIDLRFDYPGSWVFNEQKRGAGLIITGLNDPRFLTLPTPSPDNFHPVPNDFASVDIWVYPLENGETLDTEIGAFKHSNNGTSWKTFLNEYKITIDGYDATVLEYQIGPIEPFPESYTSLMFERSTFFVVEDQIYAIFFTIAEKDRNGEFEKGYEYFFKSLKIVP